jgi:hypothetical protein
MINPRLVDIGANKIILIENLILDQPKKNYLCAKIEVYKNKIDQLPFYETTLRRDFSAIYDSFRD